MYQFLADMRQTGDAQSMAWCLVLVPPFTKKHKAFWHLSKGRDNKLKGADNG